MHANILYTSQGRQTQFNKWTAVDALLFHTSTKVLMFAAWSFSPAED